MKFNVGDTVRVTTYRFGSRYIGNIGVIIQINLSERLKFLVKTERGHNPYNTYSETDLELYKPPPLLQPDFSLDEIASAQEIIDQMG